MKAQLVMEVVRKEPVRWGGRRAGAGRKRTLAGKRRGPHRAREWFSPRHPIHVVLRVDPVVGRLRRRKAYQAFRWALLTSLRRDDFRVVHVSIQGNHVHLLCEANGAMALSRGVRGLSISAARRLNAAISVDLRLARRRTGRVFCDRYHATVINSPRQARGCLAYVLNNWRHHREDHAGAAQRRARIDPYSSAVAFPGWAGRDGAPFGWPRGYEPLPVSYPTTWMLTAGWRRAGPELEMTHTP